MPSYLPGMTMSTPYGRSPTCSSSHELDLESSALKPTAPRTPSPPALDTAAATSRQWVKAKIGNSMPRRSQSSLCRGDLLMGCRRRQVPVEMWNLRVTKGDVVARTIPGN